MCYASLNESSGIFNLHFFPQRMTLTVILDMSGLHPEEYCRAHQLLLRG